MNWDEKREWVSDESGNRCSVACFGTEEAAEQALSSLKGCSDCSNCSNCSNCSGCSYCSSCSNCSNCSGCSYCSSCSNCSYCSYCSDCDGKQGAQENFAPQIPKIERIHKAVYEAAIVEGALDMGYWHADGHCGTTHCRAGWVTHLAGEPGLVLEDFHGPELAAMLIYRESGSPINPARFYDSDEDALAHMKECAEAEAAA